MRASVVLVFINWFIERCSIPDLNIRRTFRYVFVIFLMNRMIFSIEVDSKRHDLKVFAT